MKISTPIFLILLSVWVIRLNAAVLPEDRADALFHSYDGGGAEISGPSILVRKKFGDSVSFFANHYVDNVSSASIDVITTASPYTEQRVEGSLGLDILHNKTTMSLSFTDSIESDFDATTYSMSFSQDMFGDLTTVSLGFTRGDNEIRRSDQPDFLKHADTRGYRLGLSQILTKNLIMSFALEGIADQGFLNNPYRSVRYVDDTLAVGYNYESEKYPGTRTSVAFAVRARYYLERRAALHSGYRIFSDSWGIKASTFELGYTLPYEDQWIIETSLRFYDQTSAEFYSDLFPYEGAKTFLARDKELSTFSSLTLGAGFSYELSNKSWTVLKRGSLSFHLDHILFDYDDFRDLTSSGSLGNEPLYSFEADVLRIFASFWF
ncbi:MAG: DUF3570 domain-containing protein [Gammaproteobacteria bacterium]|nr:DUF3570 domain-containing protein [Gammaproteobacteria bacterium]